jgi:signal peptidase I
MDRRAVSVLRDLARDGQSSVIVRGHCMEPLLRSGEAVTVRARRIYLPGDVIVFRTHGGELAAHRVLGWRPAGVVTKGDHCDIHDAPVPRAEIVGAVDVHVRVRERVQALGALLRIIVRRLAR